MQLLNMIFLLKKLIINEDRTKYILLSEKDYYSCNNRYMQFCNPKSPIYQTNLSKSCVIALFLKNEENVQHNCKSMVYLNSRLVSGLLRLQML